MPWRGTRDGYRVWVSEIMLQQTRVAAVLPYYRRFVKKFPTVRALARARSEDVLKLWAGLGYYSRARNLHRAAKEILAQHDGKFPRSHEAALALPGVGRYTVAAVLSIAFGEPLAVVDGNVARVVARLVGMRGDLRTNERWRQIEETAQELMGGSGEWRVASSGKTQKPKIEKRKTAEQERRERIQRESVHGETARSKLRAGKREQAPALHTKPGEWNQAMMELGATLCTPRAPRCGECPVARWCKARALGIAERIPPARKKHKPERVEIAAAVLLDPRGRTLLVKPLKAETNGLFSRMWQFPAVKLKSGKQIEEWRNRGTEERNTPETNGAWMELKAIKHTVTYREVTLRPFLIRVDRLRPANRARIVALGDVTRMAVSSATKKIARAVEKNVAAATP
jgi:A/G-specific adenine glycosylase